MKFIVSSVQGYGNVSLGSFRWSRWDGLLRAAKIRAKHISGLVRIGRAEMFYWFTQMWILIQNFFKQCKVPILIGPMPLYFCYQNNRLSTPSSKKWSGSVTDPIQQIMGTTRNLFYTLEGECHVCVLLYIHMLRMMIIHIILLRILTMSHALMLSWSMKVQWQSHSSIIDEIPAVRTWLLYRNIVTWQFKSISFVRRYLCVSVCGWTTSLHMSKW